MLVYLLVIFLDLLFYSEVSHTWAMRMRVGESALKTAIWWQIEFARLK